MQPGGGAAKGSTEGEVGADSPIETLTEDRRGDSALSQKLGNTGLPSLADKKQLCPLVLRDWAAIEQASVPLAGILYEKRPYTA